jgi:hypothetical protein
MQNTNCAIESTSYHDDNLNVEKLAANIIDIAQNGLPAMFDSKRQLFCHRLHRSPGGKLVQDGISHRYTMMTLLGLHRLQRAGSGSPIDIGRVLDVLTADTDWIEYAGDIGVMIWTLAVIDPGRISRLGEKLNLRSALDRFRDARQCSTTELAWLLAGLAHAKSAGVKLVDHDLLAAKVYDLLKRNQGPQGLFGHLAIESSLAGRFRGRLGSFADQVYPIYALAHFGRTYCDSDAIQRAKDCAGAIVRLQGSQGEWWWHYDSATGRVSRPYPVYSVHQHGMAPMALMALEEATGTDFSATINLGLSWIVGRNVLRVDMRQPEGGVVWRDIHPRGSNAKVQELMYIFFSRETNFECVQPDIRYECRPYELGWALYAFAGKTTKKHSKT